MLNKLVLLNKQLDAYMQGQGRAVDAEQDATKAIELNIRFTKVTVHPLAHGLMHALGLSTKRSGKGSNGENGRCAEGFPARADSGAV